MKLSITLLFSILLSITKLASDGYSSPLDTISVYPIGFPFSFSSNGIFLRTYVDIRSSTKDSSYWVSSEQKIVTGKIDSAFKKDILLNSLKIDDTLILTWEYQYKNCSSCLTNRYFGTM